MKDTPLTRIILGLCMMAPIGVLALLLPPGARPPLSDELAAGLAIMLVIGVALIITGLLNLREQKP